MLIFLRAVITRHLGFRNLTTATHEAFLERLDSHPGVTCLSLNRPQSKNAISLRLLQVNKISRHVYP